MSNKINPTDFYKFGKNFKDFFYEIKKNNWSLTSAKKYILIYLISFIIGIIIGFYK